MKNINPLGRVPETEESMAMAGCHCVCSIQMNNHDITGVSAWLPGVQDCQCSCEPNNASNSSANHTTAYNAAQ